MSGAISTLPGGDRLHRRACWFLKIKTGPETARLFGCRCPPTPHSCSKVFPSSPKHIQSNSGQYPIFEKGRIKRKNKENWYSSPPAGAHDDADARISGPERGGHCFHVPGHSHPVSGSLSYSASGHHPAGRILTGKTGVGAEEGLGGPGEEEEGILGTVHATGSRRWAGLWWNPERGRWSGPSGHRMRVLGSEVQACHCRCQRNQARTNAFPLLPCLLHKPKPQVENGDCLFFFPKKAF